MKIEDIISKTGNKVTDKELEKAASLYGLTKNHIKTVLMVESGGGGFYNDKKPRILFEAKQFSDFTGHKFDTSNPTVSSKVWNRSLYSKHSEDEFNRLKEAMSLDNQAALKSASFGLFQILGSNFHECGCVNVDSFVLENCKDEIDQVKLFLHYLHSRNLIDHLKNEEWAVFARSYNGPSYQQNKYDEKLKNNFDKLENE